MTTFQQRLPFHTKRFALEAEGVAVYDQSPQHTREYTVSYLDLGTGRSLQTEGRPLMLEWGLVIAVILTGGYGKYAWMNAASAYERLAWPLLTLFFVGLLLLVHYRVAPRQLALVGGESYLTFFYTKAHVARVEEFLVALHERIKKAHLADMRGQMRPDPESVRHRIGWLESNALLTAEEAQTLIAELIPEQRIGFYRR